MNRDLATVLEAEIERLKKENTDLKLQLAEKKSADKAEILAKLLGHDTDTRPK